MATSEHVLKHFPDVNGKWKCEFCKHEFPKTTLITWMKGHLFGVRRDHGVELCGNVPPHVREADYLSIGETKRLKTTPGNDEVRNTISIAPGARKDDRLMFQDLEMETEDKVMFARTTKGDSLLTTNMVGKAFQRNVDEILGWLLNDNVLRIGICGMAGSGKTALAKHLHNMLLQIPNEFNYVYWVTVSSNFTVHKLQGAVGKALQLDLSNEDDEHKRAAKLSKALIGNKKSVFILDDVWNYIAYDRVGFPTTTNLILTTRSLDVCRMIGCQKKIKLELLSLEEGWNLFKQTLGHERSLSPEILEIEKSVSDNCGGLALMIIWMAKNMREVDEGSIWSVALEKMERSRTWEDENEVFQSLKLSYEFLNDSTSRNCFLYCALYPRDHEIETEDLIQHLIAEGIIKRKKSRQAEFDQGYTIINELENVCLLEKINYGKFKMHPLIRDLACQILRMSSTTMVEAGVELEEVPHVGEWKENLVRVSLMKNEIVEIPSTYMPRCPNLSTLLLNGNKRLKLIADSFFEHLHKLKVLDVSHSGIEKLPLSICNLANLTALLLNGCAWLRYVPSLARLRELQMLNLKGTSIEKMPEGVGLLCNLQYLDLSDSILELLPTEILPNLSHLRVLLLTDFMMKKRVKMTVKGREVKKLRKLETLECRFENLTEFNEYVESLKEAHLLSTYFFIIGKNAFNYYDDKISKSSEKRVWMCDCTTGGQEDSMMFPKDVQEVLMEECDGLKCLSDISAFRYTNELKRICLAACGAMEWLVLMPLFSYNILKSVEVLVLSRLNKLYDLIRREDVVPTPLPSSNTFSCLKSIELHACNRMKKLFPLWLLPNLQNIEEIIIHDCDEIEEVIATDDRKGEREGGAAETSSSIECNLPKLRKLELGHSPKLRSICNEIMTCHSLETIEVIDCRGIKRMPICTPLPFFETFNFYPDEWFESLEWGDSNTKSDIQALFGF